jgi:tRNA 2-thiouridine synthesizing protein A
MAEILNLRGLKCPLPVLRTRKALRRLPAGAELMVECTDPLSAIDIPNLLRETGDELKAQVRAADVVSFHIRKACKDENQ